MGIFSTIGAVVGGAVGGPAGAAIGGGAGGFLDDNAGGIAATGGAIAAAKINADAARDAANIQAEAADRARQESLDFLSGQADTGRTDVRDATERARGDLIGSGIRSEVILNQGADDIRNTARQQAGRNRLGLSVFEGQARGELDRGFGSAEENLRRNLGIATGNYQDTRNFLRDAHGNALAGVTSAEGRARGDLTGARDLALGRIDQGIAGVEGDFQPYTGPGGQANALRAALTGVLGPEAQQAAFDNYIESPGQAYLREQDERAVLRNAAATGGLRGANVLEELGRRSTGRNSLRLDTDIGHLGNIANSGLSAAGTQAGLRANLQSGAAGIEGTTGQNLAQVGLESEQQRQRSRALHRAAVERSLNTLGNRQTNVFNDLSDLDVTRTGADVALSDVLNTRSQGINDQYFNTLAGTDANLAANLAEISSTGGVNLANLSQGQGTTLANIATGTGSQGANLINTNINRAGLADSFGELGQAAAVTSGIDDLSALLGNYLGSRNNNIPPPNTQLPANVFDPNRSRGTYNETYGNF